MPLSLLLFLVATEANTCEVATPVAYRAMLAAEAPETLRAPLREEFATQHAYARASFLYRAKGNWATPDPDFPGQACLPLFR